jgi:hypothetical protein
MVTLEQLKIEARQRADMENSDFVSDSELTSYINGSLAELHDLLIAAYCEEYVMNEQLITTTTNQLKYALPADFYKLRGVDVKTNVGDGWSTVKRFNFNRRNQASNTYAFDLLGLPYLEYRLVGSNILLNRIPSPTTTLRLWYYPKVVKLVADSDTFDDVNGYAEYVILDAAIKMKEKEESDVRVLAGQKQAMKQRIEAMAQNRDANEPESVSDVYAEESDVVFIGRR